MTFITHGFRVSVVSDVLERVRDLGLALRFMLRRSSLVECVSMLHGTCLQCADFFLSVCAAMFVKKSEVYILYHKELADARILILVFKDINHNNTFQTQRVHSIYLFVLNKNQNVLQYFFWKQTGIKNTK